MPNTSFRNPNQFEIRAGDSDNRWPRCLAPLLVKSDLRPNSVRGVGPPHMDSYVIYILAYNNVARSHRFGGAMCTSKGLEISIGFQYTGFKPIMGMHPIRFEHFQNGFDRVRVDDFTEADDCSKYRTSHCITIDRRLTICSIESVLVHERRNSARGPTTRI